MEDQALISKKEKERGLPRLSSPANKRRIKSSLLKASIVFLILTILITAGLFAWKHFLDNQAQALEDERRAVIAERDKVLETRVNNLSAIMVAYENLSVQHRNWTRLLSLLEERTLPTVTFTNFDGSYDEGLVKLEGEALDYAAVAEQIRALEQVEGFTAVSVETIELNKLGNVAFSITVSFAKNTIIGAPAAQ